MTHTRSYQRERRGLLAAGVVLAAMAAVPLPVWGQWNGTNPVWTNSNVGIGTISPAASLVVQTGPTSDMFVGSSIVNGRGQLRLYGGNNFGVAVVGNEYYDGVSLLKRVTAGGGGHMFIDNSTGSTAGDISFATWPSGAQDSTLSPATTLTIKNSGNVGIATTNPGSFKLAVEGTIGARDVTVTNANPWPDYVFRPGYRLRPLRELSQFIRTNGHLPDIPTEAEVKEEGINLGEMQARLLTKVEESTLHLIEADKRSDRLERENRALRERMTQQEVRDQHLQRRLAHLAGAKDRRSAMAPREVR